MLFFKKSKPKLHELIPNNFVDIHSHLLPSIDDGSTSDEMTLELVKNLKNIGFNQFITTPHVMDYVWKNSKFDIETKYQYTATFLKKSSIENSFKVAAEYMLDDNFRTLFETEELLCLKQKYILIEMSYFNAPLNLYDVLFDLQVAGYKPILAHPERYNFYHNNLKEYDKLKTVGCKFQLNLLSSVGYYNPVVAKVADYLLENNMIDFVGSDVHHQKHIDAFSNKIILKNSSQLIDAIEKNGFFGL